MSLRQVWLGITLVCMGCQMSLPVEPEHRPPPEKTDRAALAEQLWDEGQQAMKDGQPRRAIACYQQSLEEDPTLARNHLSLAAAHLELGDEKAACPHLAQYVEAQPEHLVIRAHLAELLMRQNRPAEARTQFERFIAAAQEQKQAPFQHLIHCHSRLMEIAMTDADEYRIHLHRGIGLFLLARERSSLADPNGALPVEGLLCKAAAELSQAQAERPDEARACWYLFEVWSRLAQRQKALLCLRAAQSAAPFSYLTPAEKRDLQLAAQCQELAPSVK